MSVAPPPATYTATNNLNMMKNIFTPQYKFTDGYFRAYVNTQLPGNVTVGDSKTAFLMTLNGIQVTTLSDLQNWSQWSATYNLNMNTCNITQVGNVAFGANPTGQYTINAQNGSINISSYYLNGMYTDLSGGIPSWSTRVATSSVNMNAKNIQNLCNVNFTSGVSLSSSANVLTFSNSGGERMRIAAAGGVSIGTSLSAPGCSVTISAGLAVLSNLYVTASENFSGFSSNVFVVKAGADIEVGSVGPNTNLFLTTAGRRQVKIDTGGNLTVLQGSMTALLSIDAPTTSLVLTTTNWATTFVVTAGTTINLPGNVVKGTYWVVKNVGAGTITNTVVGGTILNGVNPLSSMAANAVVTIVSYSNGNYYAV